jgi:hypothetical protein
MRLMNSFEFLRKYIQLLNILFLGIKFIKQINLNYSKIKKNNEKKID